MKQLHATGLTMNALLAVWFMIDKKSPMIITWIIFACVFNAWHLAKEKDNKNT